MMKHYSRTLRDKEYSRDFSVDIFKSLAASLLPPACVYDPWQELCGSHCKFFVFVFVAHWCILRLIKQVIV